MLSAEREERARSELAVRHAVADCHRADADRAASVAVPIAITSASALDLFRELIDIIDAARRVHPTGMGIEALVDEELAPGRGTIHVEPFVARHLQLGTEIPAGVRVDEEERFAVLR